MAYPSARIKNLSRRPAAVGGIPPQQQTSTEAAAADTSVSGCAMVTRGVPAGCAEGATKRHCHEKCVSKRR